MITLTFQNILTFTGGTLLCGDASTTLAGISTDSRTLAPRNLFIALRGEKFDGHRFITDALRHQPAGLIVEELPAIPLPTDIVVIKVRDTLQALGDIAHGWRQRFAIPVIALTGTSGKTSTKELIRACLATEHQVLATEGNFNNLIGLPKTLFNLTEAHDMAVLEMGMNRFGEIARMMDIAAPQYGLITNIGAGHTEGVGSIEGVAKAKGELVQALGAEGCLFANMEDPYIVKMLPAFPGDVIRYGCSAACDISASNIRFEKTGLRFAVRTPWESREFNSRFWGTHHVLNALAAIAIAQSFQVGLEACAQVIETMQGTAGRGRLIRLQNGSLLLDEAYNANPSSVRATLDWFKNLDPDYNSKIFVFGTMKELGAQAETLHTEMITHSVAVGVTDLYLYGEFAPLMADYAIKHGIDKGRIHCFDKVEALARSLKEAVGAHTAIAVKASHTCGFEKIVQELTTFMSS